MRHAAAIALITETGADSVDPGGMRQGLDVYCGYDAGGPGYRNGGYSNMNAIKAMFPGKKYLCVGTDCIDIESGLASPDEAPGFVNGWKKDNTNRPVCYANGSTMPAVKSALSGIDRNRYYLWLADPNGDPSVPSGYDGKQWEFAQGFDADSFYEYMWVPVTKPPPPPPAKGTFPAPKNLSARGGHTTVALAWSAVIPPKGMSAHVTGYQIEVYNDPPVINAQKRWTVVRDLKVTVGLSVQLHGLTRGNAYQVHIWALGSPVTSDKNFASAKFKTG
jgi:hypothetical protein